jgi:hypothetical protein
MPSDRLRNVDHFIDRHGKPRHYYRRGKSARIRLPGEPGSPEFMFAYASAAAKDVSYRDGLIEASIGQIETKMGDASLPRHDSAGLRR